MRRYSGILLVVFAVAVDTGFGQEPKTPSVKELIETLDTPIDVRPFMKEMTLKDALKALDDACRAKGKILPVFVDIEAFKEENPDAPELDETQIRFPALPMQRTIADMLPYMLKRIPTQNASFIVKPGHIEITTLERSHPSMRLRQKISIRFDARPLHQVIDEISQRTGLLVMLDPRVAEKARTPVSGVFVNTSLGSALYLPRRHGGPESSRHGRIDYGHLLSRRESH